MRGRSCSVITGMSWLNCRAATIAHHCQEHSCSQQSCGTVRSRCRSNRWPRTRPDSVNSSLSGLPFTDGGDAIFRRCGPRTDYWHVHPLGELRFSRRTDGITGHAENGITSSQQFTVVFEPGLVGLGRDELPSQSGECGMSGVKPAASNASAMRITSWGISHRVRIQICSCDVNHRRWRQRCYFGTIPNGFQNGQRDHHAVVLERNGIGDSA